MVTDNHPPQEDISFHFRHHRAEFPEWCNLCWYEEIQDEGWETEGGSAPKEKGTQ